MRLYKTLVQQNQRIFVATLKIPWKYITPQWLYTKHKHIQRNCMNGNDKWKLINEWIRKVIKYLIEWFVLSWKRKLPFYTFILSFSRFFFGQLYFYAYTVLKASQGKRKMGKCARVEKVTTSFLLVHTHVCHWGYISTPKIKISQKCFFHLIKILVLFVRYPFWSFW